VQNDLDEAASTVTQQQIGSTVAARQDSSAKAGMGYVAGIDIGGTNLRLALADMTGAVVAKWSSSTAGARGPDAVIALVKTGVEHLLQKVSAPCRALNAAAAGAPGITDVDSGVVIATSYLMGWRDVPLRVLLEDALNAPVRVDNDVNLAALGESWAGAAQGARDFVFIGIGTGVGASIVLNDSPWRGSSWAAGEIGYMLVPGMPEIRGNPGETGALENIIGGEGIKAQWHNACRLNGTALPKDLTATQIFDHALAGDSLAQSVLQRTSRMLSHVIYNMNLVLDCPLFVLGGGVGIHPALRSSTENCLAQLNMRGQPQLTTSALGSGAQLMGALRQALDLAGFRPAYFADKGPDIK
jgi:glucokinase